MTFDLKSYNQNQQKVITHDTGPLLVISGAGTGKTHVLTGRILYLIEERGVKPGEILALTFTEKATAEMQARLDVALPMGASGEMWVKTFHAFCETVLRERGVEIGIAPDYKLITETDLLLFLRKHVTDFKLKHYRSLSSPERILGSLKNYFSKLQEENITVEAYQNFVEKIKAGAEDAAAVENAEKHAELCRAYSVYQKIMAESGYLDFSGLLWYTLELLRKRPSVLAEYQKRFKHILVDEFQDTNFIQNKIVMLLAGAHKNLMVVGDDDQSIYKWRGASLTNIQYFTREFPDAKKIILNENYRSTQAILDLAYKVIQKNNPNRLEITEKIEKKLVAATQPRRFGRGPAEAGGQIPTVYHFPTVDEEVAFVINQAKTLLKRGQNVAILVRTNSLAMPFINSLEEQNIPLQHFSATTLLNEPGVKDCIALLQTCADPWDDVSLFRCLSLPIWQMPMENLLSLLKKARYKTQSLFEVLDEDKKGAEVKKFLEELIEFSRTHTVSDVLGKFLNESGYLDNPQTPPHHIEDIGKFSEKVAAFESIHKDTKVTDFLGYLELLEQSIESREQTENTIDLAAIKVLTIHGAKGLEFDAVFLPGLVQNKFPTIAFKDPFEIPEELIQEKLPEGDHHKEEERRLFYVGVTRAKETLVISYSDFYNGKKQWKPSMFINESLESGKAKLVSKSSKKSMQENGGQISLLTEENGQEVRTHRSLKVELPRLSYSQIDTFQTCPLKYQFRYLFQLPTVLPAQVHFGTSIHNALHNFYQAVQKNPASMKWPLLEHEYEQNWIGKGYDSRAVHNEQKEIGRGLLKDFYEEEKKEARIPAFLEEPFELKLGNLTISGRIDRIDQLPDGTYEVIDYKTGSAKNKKLDKDLQLSIYALACADVLKIPVSKLSLYFLDPLQKISTTRSAAQLETCRQELIACAQEMAESTFSPTPGFHCSYCDFRLICPVAVPKSALS